jgi:tetratricopeptide (TPR) repeat protein
VRGFQEELAKTRTDIAALHAIAARDPRDLEKRIRLAYRQFHLASLTESDTEYRNTETLIDTLIGNFGAQEDVYLLKANVDSRFHRLEGVKTALALCPALRCRPAGRAIQADIDFQEGRYRQASDTVVSLIEEHRTWDALARLAHWKGKLGEFEDADRLYEEAQQELTSKEMRSYSWLALQRGALALTRGLLELCRTHYQQAEAAFPGHWRTTEHVAGLLAAEGRWDEAEVLLRTLIEQVPKPELKQALGEMLARTSRAEDARPWLDAARTAFLASAEAGEVHYYHHLVDLLGDALSQPQQAVIWARRDVSLRPNFTTQSALAWALLRAGEWADGLQWIRLALDSGVRDYSIFETASALHRAAGDEPASEHFAYLAGACHPGTPGFHLHH